MIAVDRIALVLLAAGRSTRFGNADKLEATWRGKPLAMHAVAALKPFEFGQRIAIVSDTALDFASHGYRTILNDRPDDGLSRSLKLGVAAAQEAGAAAMLIALADMPRVTSEHIGALIDAAGEPDIVIASSDGLRVKPPALFPAGRFAELMQAEGDEGGRRLLQDARRVAASDDELFDIDTIEDLERLRAVV